MSLKKFPACDEALADVLAYTEEELEKADCPMKMVMQLTVCVEEMFVNIAHYGYPDGGGEMTYSIDSEDGVITMIMTDSGIPFDPLAKDDPDITLSAEERDIGGLGIFMVKKTMDTVAYKRENDQNIFTMTKRIG